MTTYTHTFPDGAVITYTPPEAGPPPQQFAPLPADYPAAVAVPPLNETAGNLGYLTGPTEAECANMFGGASVVEGAIAVKVRLQPSFMGGDGNKPATYIMGHGTPASQNRAWCLYWLGGAAAAANAGRFQWQYQRGTGDNITPLMPRRIAPNEQGVVEAFLVFRRKADAGGTWEALAIQQGDTAVVAPIGDEITVDNVLGISSALQAPLRLFTATAAAANAFNYAGGCALSDLIYIQGAAGTDAEWLRVANGENPATVFPSTLHYHYPLGGSAGLAKAAGSRATSPFTVQGSGVYYSTQLLPTAGTTTAANSIYVLGSNWGHVHPLPPSALIENEAAAGGLAGIMTKTTTVLLPVSIGGTATRVEARVCREDDGAVIQDWTLRDVEGGTGAALTGNHTLIIPGVRPANGLGHVYDVRRQDDPSCVFRYRAREDVGIGAAWGASQSQMARVISNDAGAAGTGLVTPVAGVGDTVTVTLERAGKNGFVPPANAPLRAGLTTNGFMAFANMWRSNFPTLKVHITALSKSGTSTQMWLEDKVNAVTPLNWWGDGANPASGVVTAHTLAARRRFSAFLVSWHTDDRGKIDGWQERFNELFSLNEASAGAAVTGWTVPYTSRKSFAKFPGGLVFTPHIIGFPVSRESEATGGVAMTASRSRTFAAQRKQQFDYFSNGVGRAAGITSYVANYQTATEMPVAREAHHTNAAARGNPLFSVQVAQGLARAAGLTPGWYVGAGRDLPKVSGATGAGTPTITVSFALPAGWTLRTLDPAATAVEEFWVSQDNGVNWVRANTLGTVTIVSGQVRLAKTTGNWAGVGNMLIQYNASAPVSTGTLATDNTQLGQMLFAEMPVGETVRALWPAATTELVDGLPIAPDIDPVAVLV